LSNIRPISKYSRQELYDLIWSTSTVQLAKQFGVSDVAIAKRCKRLQIPKPAPGYWAKVAVGRKPGKPLLPPALPTTAELFKANAQRTIPKALRLPATTQQLLPLASELLSAMTKAKLDHYKRTEVEEPTLPRVTVSRSLAQRVAGAFHVLLKQLEPCGILFRKCQGTYDSGYFRRHNDRLFLAISEDVIRTDGSSLSSSSWRPAQHTDKPCGRMTFTVHYSLNGYRKSKEWSENAKVTLQETLAQVVAGIRQHYLDLHEQRERQKIESARREAEWLIQEREWEKKEAIRIQREKEQRHAAGLAAVPQARNSALLKAAQNWHLNRIAMEFIDACEAQWKNQSAALTAEQCAWLAWARETAASTSPFSAGYPDPQSDAAFNPALIPFGGPYPPPRKFA
jgi:hypothetical protein